MEKEVRTFFDEYGVKEWNRLEENGYSRMNYWLHLHFLGQELREGMSVLDAGCGAGRYSLEFAKRGCRVTLFDISDVQLRIARDKIAEAGLEHLIDGYVQGDIRDLSAFGDQAFDAVVCYGAPLSYVLEQRELAVAEFNRVLKEGGQLYASVNNKWGILKMLLGAQYPGFFNDPAYWHIHHVMETGDLPAHEKVNQPPRHFFEAAELGSLLEAGGFSQILLGGSPCFSCGNAGAIEAFSGDEQAMETILQIELATYTKPTMVDNGEFLLAKGVKKTAERPG